MAELIHLASKIEEASTLAHYIYRIKVAQIKFKIITNKMTDAAKRTPKRPHPEISRTQKPRLCSITSVYKELKSAWNASNINLEKCGRLLEELKLKLLHVGFLPVTGSAQNKQEMLMCRDILEIGVLWSVASMDIQSFERYMSLVKNYYFDYKRILPESPLKYQILGLNLMYLLSQNRVAEFHTELERLPPDYLQRNVFIRHPLMVEQYLMEGSYNKIFYAKWTVPSESYTLFMDILLETIRGEIAACIEQAYQKISLKDLMAKLHLTTEKDATDYGVKVKKWKLRKNHFVFGATEDKVEEREEVSVPARSFAENAVQYAKELEMIV